MRACMYVCLYVCMYSFIHMAIDLFWNTLIISKQMILIREYDMRQDNKYKITACNARHDKCLCK